MSLSARGRVTLEAIAAESVSTMILIEQKTGNELSEFQQEGSQDGCQDTLRTRHLSFRPNITTRGRGFREFLAFRASCAGAWLGRRLVS